MTKFTDIDDMSDAEIDRRLDAALARRTDLDQPAYPQCGVYFIACATFVKIGCARTCSTRLAELRRVVPFPLDVLGWIPCGDPAEARQLERTLHHRFAATRLRGEWFTDHDALRACIAAMARPWLP